MFPSSDSILAYLAALPPDHSAALCVAAQRSTLHDAVVAAMATCPDSFAPGARVLACYVVAHARVVDTLSPYFGAGKAVDAASTWLMLGVPEVSSSYDALPLVALVRPVAHAPQARVADSSDGSVRRSRDFAPQGDAQRVERLRAFLAAVPGKQRVQAAALGVPAPTLSRWCTGAASLGERFDVAYAAWVAKQPADFGALRHADEPA